MTKYFGVDNSVCITSNLSISGDMKRDLQKKLPFAQKKSIQRIISRVIETFKHFFRYGKPLLPKVRRV